MASKLEKKRHMNALQPGYELHWYRIKEILGQGGFGITYLAYDLNLDHEVAIKEYLPIELSSRNTEDYSVHPVSDEHKARYLWGLERFLDEAKTIGQFKHPNIVRVRNVFEANNTAYMVMDYELGESLQDILNRRKVLPEEDVKSVIFPILDGVKIVHAAGYIHRDIKPANIFIRVDGDPVLLDFGSARQSLEEKKESLTSLFSKGYAPIEQYQSSDDEQQGQGPWTDIYSLGATMYRMIAGVPPTDAVDRSSAIVHTGKDTYVTAVEIGEGRQYSKSLLEAIDYALQFKRQDRPPTVSDWQMSFSRTGDETDENPVVTSPTDDVSVCRFTAAQMAAEEGDIEAQAELAYCYAKGIGTEPDDLQAFNWYYNSAEQGHRNSQYNLGVMYAKGRGVKQNFIEAFHWYKQAAEQGDSSAEATLGMMCSRGIGTEKSDVEAFNWYQKSAQQGVASSQFTLGNMYMNGRGTTPNDKQAFKWFKKAAEQGHANAQLNLGFLFGKGKGVERDDTEAYLWIRKAAEAGHPTAQYNLGVIYAKGRGIEKNLKDAKIWYGRAAEQGDENAKRALEKLKSSQVASEV